jgi:hypothetical protein
VYNLMKMSEFPTKEGTDRPLDPPLILKTEARYSCPSQISSGVSD